MNWFIQDFLAVYLTYTFVYQTNAFIHAFLYSGAEWKGCCSPQSYPTRSTSSRPPPLSGIDPWWAREPVTWKLRTEPLFKVFYLEAKARIWPWLSYMYRNRSKVEGCCVSAVLGLWSNESARCDPPILAEGPNGRFLLPRFPGEKKRFSFVLGAVSSGIGKAKYRFGPTVRAGGPETLTAKMSPTAV